MKIKRNQKGFTLIEVVLVLAIGGLIFLLAFLAFQQVSTNRRDTARRNDANRFVSEVANYSGDAAGKIPGQTGALTVAQFVTQYMGGTNFKDPQGNAYTNVAAEADVDTDSEFYFSAGRKCSGNASTAANASDYAIVMDLEKGKVCRSNTD